MSYRKIDEIPKSPKTKGRLWQYIGTKRVRKYAFSPFTAKPKERYTFYADIILVEPIMSPRSLEPSRTTRYLTIEVYVGTYLGFRDAVLTGEVRARIAEYVLDAEIRGVSYWRSRSER